MRISTLAGLSWTDRILSSGSCTTPWRVPPENPAKSINDVLGGECLLDVGAQAG
jgi:hypothetical protein